jgi:hypothetical protein
METQTITPTLTLTLEYHEHIHRYITYNQGSEEGRNDIYRSNG